jgi:hypothetical protein
MAAWKATRPPLWLQKMCGHGKPLDEDCLACAMMWRIEQRKDAEIIHLRARVQELESQNGTINR